MNILIYSTCLLGSSKINYAVTHASGHIITWGQEYLAVANRTQDGIVHLILR